MIECAVIVLCYTIADVRKMMPLNLDLDLHV